ncbi:cupin domain-containing protein [Erythrobacter sp. HA6-11]
MANLFPSLALALASAVAVSTPALAQEWQNIEPEAAVTHRATLDRFVADYSNDPMAEPVRFGLEVEGHRFHVEPVEDGFELRDGFGGHELFYFTMSRETLNLLDQGVWNGLTAMAAATSADVTPLDVLQTEGFEEPDDYTEITRKLIGHFWSRGIPEVTNFGLAHARVVHGAPATALYYDKDFRSAVYEIPSGLGREQAPTMQVPFPRMIILIKGAAEGEMDGNPFTAKAGQMLFSPPNIPVTFWNASDEEPMSFVWLMWGDGA